MQPTVVILYANRLPLCRTIHLFLASFLASQSPYKKTLIHIGSCISASAPVNKGFFYENLYSVYASSFTIKITPATFGPALEATAAPIWKKSSGA